MIAYKQRQQEKRFKLAIKELQDRQDKTDKILEKYNEDIVPQIRKLIDINFHLKQEITPHFYDVIPLPR